MSLFFMFGFQLTASQQRAVSHGPGPVVVCAGPGTGKTRTLICRIAWLIDQGLAAPEEILAVTFTQKAAEEMRRRLEGLKEGETWASRVRISTFHGLCLRLLQENLPTPFRLLSEPQALAVLKETIEESFPEFPLRRLKELARRIGVTKNHLLPPETTTKAFSWDDLPFFPEIYKAYQKKLVEGGVGDFDDLLIRTVNLLEKDPILKDQVRRRYPFVLVDEFQDINLAQYRLFQSLSREEGPWMVIGDPNQAIYGFRGSHPDYFFRLKEIYPKAEWIVLEESFRLNATVVQAAHGVLKSETPIKALKAGPPLIPVIGLDDDESEAEYIAEIVEKEVGGLSFLSAASSEGPGKWGVRSLADIAVLYRLHAQGDRLAEVFTRRGIPFQRVSEIHWAEFPETRILLKKIQALKGKDLSPAAAVEESMAGEKDPFWTVGEGVEVLKRLRSQAASFSGSLSEFVEDLSLLTGLDTFEPEQEAVALLTLHAAKGLEFPLVIISGCEETLLPLSLLKESEPEEERRLFYVGLTRAVDRVVLTWARRRTLFGRRLDQRRSPFVEDMGRELLEERSLSKGKPRKSPRSRQLDLFGR